MIRIESLPDDTPQLPDSAGNGPGCLSFVFLGGGLSIVFFVILIGPGVGILRDFGMHPLQALPILLVLAAVISAITFWSATVYSRKVHEKWQRRIELASAPTRALARRYGYVPAAERGSDRHRVVISNIQAIWSVDDLEDFGPGYVLRSAEGEYVFCAGEALLDNETADDDVFDNRSKILTLELGGGLTELLTAKWSGERVPVAVEGVPYDVCPADCEWFGFALFDDPEIIRRLPPVADELPS